jgi:hypothetical protein
MGQILTDYEEAMRLPFYISNGQGQGRRHRSSGESSEGYGVIDIHQIIEYARVDLAGRAPTLLCAEWVNITLLAVQNAAIEHENEKRKGQNHD